MKCPKCISEISNDLKLSVIITILNKVNKQIHHNNVVQKLFKSLVDKKKAGDLSKNADG